VAAVIYLAEIIVRWLSALWWTMKCTTSWDDFLKLDCFYSMLIRLACTAGTKGLVSHLIRVLLTGLRQELVWFTESTGN